MAGKDICFAFSLSICSDLISSPICIPIQNTFMPQQGVGYFVYNSKTCAGLIPLHGNKCALG